MCRPQCLPTRASREESIAETHQVTGLITIAVAICAYLYVWHLVGKPLNPSKAEQIRSAYGWVKLIVPFVILFGILEFYGVIGTRSASTQPSDRFVSLAVFEKSKELQVAKSQRRLEQLHAEPDSSNAADLDLVYQFATNAEEKALALSLRLSNKGYSVQHGPAVSDDRLIVITGSTFEMPMTQAAIRKWTEEMCQIGYEYDCLFTGWERANQLP